VNGNEKLIRMLIIPKRNYPIGLFRPSFTNRGANYSGFAVQTKCSREDMLSKTITLHYVTDGRILLRVIIRKQEFLIPVMVLLKSLYETSDIQLFNSIARGDPFSNKLEILLSSIKQMSLNTQQECLAYLGKHFRTVMSITNPELMDHTVGQIFMEENICIHLQSNVDKFNFLCLMIEKLLALVAGKCKPENLDSLMAQEVLLTGHLYMMLLKEKLEETLQIIRLRVLKDANRI